MYLKLTIQERLKDLRTEQKLTLEQLAEKTGISKSALGKYETEEYKDMSPFNLVTLANFYGVSTDYLLGLTEQKNHPNADINNLHLSDDMIDLLESGKINTRLLCEIATHEDFRRFLTDIEIYVDRIADMRINDLNAVLGVVRNAAMDRCSDENDLYVRTLELAQVDEDEYFSHVIHKDLDRIISTIRENHKKDRTSADTVSPAADAQKQLQDALNFEGSDEEKKVKMYLNTLGIDYNSLTKEELVTQINILKKSKHMKSPYNQRGKASTKHSGNKRKKK